MASTNTKNDGLEGDIKRRHRSRKVNESEAWNIVKVLLDLLESVPLYVLLENVRADDWNKSMNGLNLWERIQAEPEANECRTGSCLKNYFKVHVKKRSDLIEKFKTRINLYDVALVQKLNDLVSEYRETRRYSNSSIDNANLPLLAVNAKTAPNPFSLIEQANMVFGVCCLLERYSVEEVKRSLNTKWDLEVEDGLNLAEFIRAIDGSDKNRPIKSFRTKWSRMAGRDRERLFILYDGVFQEFSAVVQEKVHELVKTITIA